jgi:hypothetical protein
LYWFSFRCTASWHTNTLQAFNNPHKVAFGVPFGGHAVEPFIFPAVMQTTLSLLREQMLLSRWLAMNVYSWCLETCLSRVAQQLTVPAGCHVNVPQQSVT